MYTTPRVYAGAHEGEEHLTPNTYNIEQLYLDNEMLALVGSSGVD